MTELKLVSSETEKAMRRMKAADAMYEALIDVSARLAIHMTHTEDLMAHMKAMKAIALAENGK